MAKNFINWSQDFHNINKYKQKHNPKTLFSANKVYGWDRTRQRDVM